MSKIAQPSVGVVILTYNSATYIVPCLKSVLANTHKNFKVLVVDNASTDDTVNLIQENFSRITQKRSFAPLKMTKRVSLIRNKKNLGYAAGNNIGIKHFLKQKTDYILLLNPDTIIKKTLIKACSDVLIRHYNVEVVGPMIMYMQDKQKVWFAGGYFNKFFCYARHPGMDSIQSRGQRAKGEELIIRETDFISGACMMVRTSMLKQTGLLPEGYFLYFEDVFFCQKIRGKGYQAALLAKPLAFHAVSSSTGIAGENTFTPLKAYYFARNPIFYIRHNVQGLYKVTNYAGQLFIRLPHYLWQFAKQRNFVCILYYFKGLIDGLAS